MYLKTNPPPRLYKLHWKCWNSFFISPIQSNYLYPQIFQLHVVADLKQKLKVIPQKPYIFFLPSSFVRWFYCWITILIRLFDYFFLLILSYFIWIKVSDLNFNCLLRLSVLMRLFSIVWMFVNEGLDGSYAFSSPLSAPWLKTLCFKFSLSPTGTFYCSVGSRD